MTIWFIAKVIVFILLVWWLVVTIKRTKVLSRIGRRLKKTPQCRPDLIGCYVKFSGVVASENKLHSPLANQNCIFHHSELVANWTTKIKKPGKGTEQHRKLIASKNTAEALLLKDNKGLNVFINAEEFYAGHGDINIPQKEGESRQCPEAFSENSDARFKKYEWREDIICAGDKIELYAELSQHSDGTLWLKPTKIEDYASIVFACQAKMADTFSIKQILKRYLRRYTNQKRMIAVILLIQIFYISVVWKLLPA